MQGSNGNPKVGKEEELETRGAYPNLFYTIFFQAYLIRDIMIWNSEDVWAEYQALDI